MLLTVSAAVGAMLLCSPLTVVADPREQSAADDRASPRFVIELSCGSESYDPALERLFVFAEEHPGEVVHADISLHSSACQCLEEHMPDDDEETLAWIRKLNLRCDISTPELPASAHCLGSLNLGGAGIGSFCYPDFNSLPAAGAYSGSIAGDVERVSGDFTVMFEFSLGARHVRLLLTEREWNE